MSCLIATEDGSLTCRHVETGELYHNRAGAYSEALHNYYFPCAALMTVQTYGELRLLDACFGLGYNSLVLLSELVKQNVQATISITGIEIDAEILSSIPSVLCDSRFASLKSLFGDNLPAGFGVWRSRIAGLQVNLDIRRQDLREFLRSAKHEAVDLVFHDPFSPAKMPELWSVDIFQHYYQLLRARQGKLLTYSSAYAVRGGLRQAQFHIFRTAGVGGKSGGTLATAGFPLEPLEPAEALSDEEQAGIASRSGVPYRDAGLTHSRKEILLRRSQEQTGIEIRRPC
jgi:tRNA U34 5-methylaminomethyl-2-thiouridine-forming methyltransferase MnmC